MKRCFIVAYDISDSKRLHKVAKVMKAYGQRIQFSVFRCELTRRHRVELEADLFMEIDHREDQILFIDLGPVPGRGEECIKSMGRAYLEPPRNSVVF